ncbi:twin-arginine translocase subunit TatC [Agrococcus sp. DT81.2]|uniref:twin-arginine translocase subunit TatC n=1 Tax=Agrococcus sp. DT81.2 TaxID=3393414 RepID=UPI003CE458DC
MARPRARGTRNPEGRMRLGEHLVELRRRLIISAAAILVCTIGSFFAVDWLLEVLQRPLTELAEQGRVTDLVYSTVTQAFDLKLRIAITMGVIVASPFWLYQLIRFFLPGLRTNERKYVFGFLAAALPLFLAGCAAGWFVFPHIVQLLVQIAPGGTLTYLDATPYYDFAFKLLLAVGIGFVLPVFLVVLNFAGVITGKGILRAWRWAVIGITFFTAMATPAADVMSMFLLAIPMLALYFGAAGIAIWHDRRVAKREAAKVDA